MRLQHLLLAGSLAFVGSSRPVLTHGGGPSGSFLVYVTPGAENFLLSSSEHLLIFHFPVQIPGASLAPGPYIFKLITPSVMQVTSGTRSTIYATFFTLSASGDGDVSRERVRFEQNAEDDAPRIVGWYLPGGKGYEFVYPKSKRSRVERERER